MIFVRLNIRFFVRRTMLSLVERGLAGTISYLTCNERNRIGFLSNLNEMFMLKLVQSRHVNCCLIYLICKEQTW